MKKRHSPLQPPIEKKQREKKLAGMLYSTVYRVRVGARKRRGIAAAVAAAVEDALISFGGTRGPKDSDEAIWASIAWRIGAENFAHAVIEKKHEDAADGRPRRPTATFQQFLNKRYPKPEKKGDAE